MAAGGIQCPACGAPSSVTETRKVSRDQTRRRRVCDVVACGKRFTTIELVTAGSDGSAGDFVLVNRHHMARLYAIVKRIAGERDPA